MRCRYRVGRIQTKTPPEFPTSNPRCSRPHVVALIGIELVPCALPGRRATATEIAGEPSTLNLGEQRDSRFAPMLQRD
jgi:hypothetical protein